LRSALLHAESFQHVGRTCKCALARGASNTYSTDYHYSYSSTLNMYTPYPVFLSQVHKYRIKCRRVDALYTNCYSRFHISDRYST
jgi:hypothetical protein